VLKGKEAVVKEKKSIYNSTVFSQWAKSSKNSLKECDSKYSVILSKIHSYRLKNTLLQTAFSTIFPTGLIEKLFHKLE